MIRVTKRFAPNLPTGVVYGRVAALFGVRWYFSDFSFTVASSTTSTSAQTELALESVDFVRGMAATDSNRAVGWTPLAGVLNNQLKPLANCQDYSQTLLTILQDNNISLSSKRLDIALNPNTFDAHTLVEMFDPDTNVWMLLDPTFDLTVTHASDGGWASAEDVSTATRNLAWHDVSYIFLGAIDNAVAKAYYLDYPLLYVDVYHSGEKPVNGVGGPVLPYMVQTTMPVTSSGNYAIRCPTGVSSAAMSVNGVTTTLDCSGVDGFSHVFGASSVASTANTPPGVLSYAPIRAVF